jgi:hypothetical protein
MNRLPVAHPAHRHSHPPARPQALVEALGDEDVDTFETAIVRYQQGHELRAWQVKLLLDVKKQMSAPENVEVSLL